MAGIVRREPFGAHGGVGVGFGARSDRPGINAVVRVEPPCARHGRFLAA